MDFKELLRQSLKEDVDFSVIEAALDSYVQKLNEDYTVNLAENKNKILGEKKNLQAEFEAYKESMSWVESANLTQEMYEQMNNDIESLRTSSSANDVEFQTKLGERFEAGKKAADKTYKPQIDSLQIQIKNLESKLESRNAQYVQYRVKSELMKALSEMKIEYSSYWFNGLLSSVAYETDASGNEIEINVPTDMGSGFQELPLKDWIKYFPQTDEGKKMIKVLPNSGGGASGGSGGNGEQPETTEDVYKKLFNK